MDVLLISARTTTLSLSWAMERTFASLAEVFIGQRQSTASGFVKPVLNFNCYSHQLLW